MKKIILLILGIMIAPINANAATQLYLGNSGSNLNNTMPGFPNYYKCTNSVTFSCQSDAILISYSSQTGGNGTSASPYILSGCSFISCACNYSSYLSGGKTCVKCSYDAKAAPNINDHHTNTSCQYCYSSELKINPAPSVIQCIECPSNGTCDGTTNLTCNQNYYGTTTCNSCPSVSADSGKTIAAGKKSITDCYVTNFVDQTGTGKFDPSCFYSTN